MPSVLLTTLLIIWTAPLPPGSAVKVVPPCDQNRFHSDVHDCRSDFNRSMETSGFQEICPWPDVKPLYYWLLVCVEASANQSQCSGDALLLEEVFVTVHQTYFSLCREFQDPPIHTTLVLIAPCVVLTIFMPFLCVRLTSGGEKEV